MSDLVTSIAVFLAVCALVCDCPGQALASTPEEPTGTSTSTTSSAEANASPQEPGPPSESGAGPNGEPTTDAQAQTQAVPPLVVTSQRSQPSVTIKPVHLYTRRPGTHTRGTPALSSTPQQSSPTTIGAESAASKNDSTFPTLPPLTAAAESMLLSGGAGPLTDFFINSFSIPPFLMPIYQAASTRYDVPWSILAAINEVETDYGHDLAVSSAGAQGWMQFLPSTWAQYGVDAVGDGWRDPYNPADAIFSAARYLAAAGASRNLPAAIYAYNHSTAYVESVLLRAKLLSAMPGTLLAPLTAMLDGYFPVQYQAHPRIVPERAIVSRGAPPATPGDRSTLAPTTPSAANTSPVSSASGITSTVPGARILTAAGTPVIAVQAGKIVRIGYTARLGRFVQLRDGAGNVYTYGHLGTIATRHPIPRSPQALKALEATATPPPTPRPSTPASAGRQPPVRTSAIPYVAKSLSAKIPTTAPAPLDLLGSPFPFSSLLMGADLAMFAPAVPAQPTSLHRPSGSSPVSMSTYLTSALGIPPQQLRLVPLREGSTVLAGTILGRVGPGYRGSKPQMLFEIKPAGDGRIDPRPILNNWLVLDTVQRHRRLGSPSLFGPSDAPATPHTRHVRRDKKSPALVLAQAQWTKILRRFTDLTDPNMPIGPTRAALPDPHRTGP